MTLESQIVAAATDYVAAIDSGEDAWATDSDLASPLLSSVSGPRFPRRDAAHARLVDLVRQLAVPVSPST